LNQASGKMNRRDVLNLAATTGAASLFASKVNGSEAADSASFKIVDTNVNLFHWPFRRLPLDQSEKLINKIRSLGISEAWAGSFEGVLHRNVTAVNRRLASECKRYAELVPIGTVNPLLPGWEDDLQRCVDHYDMPAIRLHPSYHGYSLDDPRFARLLQRATKAQRFVQLVAVMEDTRTQHPLLRVPDVDLAPLAKLMRRIGQAKVQILNWRPRSPLLETLAKSPGVSFDTARVEGTDGVPKLVQSVPAGRVMFGTHAPFLIPEAALIRLHESSQLDDKVLRALLSQNAQQVMGKTES